MLRVMQDPSYPARMGLWRGMTRGLARFFRLPRFGFSGDLTPSSINQVIMDASNVSGSRIPRAVALTVPAVLRGRNQICSISTLPLVQTNAAGAVQRNPFLEQIDRDVPNVAMLAQTIEDLLCESIAWWRITEQDQDDFPLHARRVDPSQVSIDPPSGTRGSNPLPSRVDPRGVPFLYVEGVRTTADLVIRFDSPNPPLLTAGAKAIRRALLLDAAAGLYATDPRPLDYFSPADGADDIEDDEVETILATWRARRKRHSTAWVPRSMTYNTVDAPSPQELQLMQLQQRASLDIANGIGVDPEDLGISTTSRTYANVNDRRQDRINEVFSPYMLAITQRLSMGDVTRRGHTVRFELGDYLKANPVDRAEIDKTYHYARVITDDEMRAGRGLPPLTDAQRAELKPAPAPAPLADPAAEIDQIDAVAEEWRRTMTGKRKSFSGEFEGVTFDVPVRGRFQVDSRKRTISGLALPYGATATKYGMTFRFLEGSLKWTSVNRVKMLVHHDVREAIGVAQNLTSTADGLRVVFKLDRSPEATRALQKAEDGVWDGLSVGVDFDYEDIVMDDDGVANVKRADLGEVSLTPMPAFDDARVTSVVASKFSKEGQSTMDECTTCGQRHAPGACATPLAQPPAQQPAAPIGVSLTNEQMTAIFSQPGVLPAFIAATQQQAQAQPVTPPGALTLTADQVTAMAQSGALAALFGMPGVLRPAPVTQPAEPPREVIDPTRRPMAVTAVSEEDPYRFVQRGNRKVLERGPQYDFSTDLISGLKDRKEEALKRATDFVRAKFDIANVEDTTDVASLNPSRQRPDLYVDQKEFIYPFYTFTFKGGLDDNTPFIFPIFTSATGLVGAHTEGTEPTGGEYKTGSTTVTPSPLSGKAVIDREVFDAGGNPKVSDLIWRAMLRGWYEGMEAAVVAVLNGTTLTNQTITLAAGATDTDLTAEVEAKLALLNFVRGGFTMRDLFTQADLWLGLSQATDSVGRKIYPVIGAQNASGTAGSLWGSLDINGVAGRPSWALAAQGQTSATPSYLLDRDAVSFWASSPNRLSFEYQVKSVELGIWGYKAGVVNDVTGVRKINWDPTL